MSKENPVFFISYAHADNKQKIVEHFLHILDQQKFPNWTLWTDNAIPIGENWSDSISEALEACDFGILLVSAAFAQSPFINNTELPELLTKKRVFPVYLSPYNLSINKTLSKKQFFQHELGKLTSFYELLDQYNDKTGGWISNNAKDVLYVEKLVHEIEVSIQNQALVSKLETEQSKDFNKGKIVHNIPPKMQVNVKITCHIKIAKEADQFKQDDDFKMDDFSEPVDLAISDYMTVELKEGDRGKFLIEPVNDPVQGLDSISSTTWIYDITPLEIGKHTLRLLAYTMLEKGRRNTRYYSKIIEVITEEVNIDKNEYEFKRNNYSILGKENDEAHTISLVNEPTEKYNETILNDPSSYNKNLKHKLRQKETNLPKTLILGNSIFLSYRRNDLAGEQVALIHTTLTREFGKRSTFWDKHMQGASQWERILRESSSSAKVCLILIGSNWNEVDKGTNKPRMFNFDDWVRIEIELAINNGLVVIPVLINGAKLPYKSEIPDSIWKIYERNAIEVETNKWEIYGDKLVNELKPIIPATPIFKKYLLPFAILILLGLGYYIYTYISEKCEVNNNKFQIGYSEKISTFKNQLNSGMYSGAPGSPMKQIKANLLSSLDLIKQYTANKTIQADIDSVMNNIEELTYDSDKRYYTITEEMKSNLLNLSNAFELYKDKCEWKYTYKKATIDPGIIGKIIFSNKFIGEWWNSDAKANTTHKIVVSKMNDKPIVKLYSKSDFIGNKEFVFNIKDSLSIKLDSIFHPNKNSRTNIYSDIHIMLENTQLRISYQAKTPFRVYPVYDIMNKSKDRQNEEKKENEHKASLVPKITSDDKIVSVSPQYAIVNGKKWMTNNLSYKFQGSESNDPYGNIYTFDQADSACSKLRKSYSDNDDWHIPSIEDWKNLISNFGNFNFNQVNEYNVNLTNTLSAYEALLNNPFSFKLGGIKKINSSIAERDLSGFYWSSSTQENGNPLVIKFTNTEDKNKNIVKGITLTHTSKTNFISCRCIKIAHSRTFNIPPPLYSLTNNISGTEPCNPTSSVTNNRYHFETSGPAICDPVFKSLIDISRIPNGPIQVTLSFDGSELNSSTTTDVPYFHIIVAEGNSTYDHSKHSANKLLTLNQQNRVMNRGNVNLKNSGSNQLTVFFYLRDNQNSNSRTSATITNPKLAVYY